jgi:TetR/AcrR family transcriptional regulator, cholesterol catabolism regulator
MQIQKEDIRKVILKVAREEFLEKGFKDTSLRTIAEKADVGLSNIYNYFANKDELFKAILSDLQNTLEKVMVEHNSIESIETYVDNTEEYGQIQFNMFLSLIENYRDDFKLLFFKSAGSSLENYREECIERFSIQGKQYIDLVKQKYPSSNNDISLFFIHTMSSWWMSSIAELVMHDLSHEELEKFLSEYMAYSTAGWKKIMKV